MAKPGNADYDRGAVPLDRVRRWRAAHPGYWRPKAHRPAPPDLTRQLLLVIDEFALRKSCDALQKTCSPLLVALLGVIARQSRNALRKAIAGEIRETMLAGYALLGIPFPRSKKPDGLGD